MIKPYPKFLLLLIANLFIINGYSQSLYERMLDIDRLIEKDQSTIASSQFKKINQSLLSKTDKALYTYIKAQLLNTEDNYAESYKYFLVSKKMYLAIDSTDRAMDINLKIFNLITQQEHHSDIYKKYFEEYIQYAYKKNDSTRIARSFIIKGENDFANNRPRQSLANFKKAIAILNKIHNTTLACRLNSNIAGIYNEELHKPDSALYYLGKELEGIRSYGSIEESCYNYINHAASYYYLHNHKKAIEYLQLADNLPLSSYQTLTREGIYECLYLNYSAIGDETNALKYLELKQKLHDSINIADQTIAINNLDKKYRTKEKELENTLLKSQVKTSRILLYSIIILLIAILVIASLMIKNSRRREKISKQDKLIEQQKFEKTLKEYELNSIDMMLEGQEKERQRLANDLHDNLGSMLATLKFNFENLRLRKMELREEENKLYERTDELIEEAYQKVRRIAHAKNAGVFASEGLIPAIQKLAEKISIPGKLQIQVIPFGFNDRLENTLEIAIFRTVQEMATNIIKHSQATEATIHLTDHEDNINIIIEDNGVGFDSSKIESGNADGMGLQNIRKKIAQLGGTLEIDSTPGKGTTIIIDIPVKND
jgi:signal transduction histidine kinase